MMKSTLIALLIVQLLLAPIVLASTGRIRGGGSRRIAEVHRGKGKGKAAWKTEDPATGDAPADTPAVPAPGGSVPVGGGDPATPQPPADETTLIGDGSNANTPQDGGTGEATGEGPISVDLAAFDMFVIGSVEQEQDVADVLQGYLLEEMAEEEDSVDSVTLQTMSRDQPNGDAATDDPSQAQTYGFQGQADFSQEGGESPVPTAESVVELQGVILGDIDGLNEFTADRGMDFSFVSRAEAGAGNDAGNGSGTGVDGTGSGSGNGAGTGTENGSDSGSVAGGDGTSGGNGSTETNASGVNQATSALDKDEDGRKGKRRALRISLGVFYALLLCCLVCFAARRRVVDEDKEEMKELDKGATSALEKAKPKAALTVPKKEAKTEAVSVEATTKTDAKPSLGWEGIFRLSSYMRPPEGTGLTAGTMPPPDPTLSHVPVLESDERVTLRAVGGAAPEDPNTTAIMSLGDDDFDMEEGEIMLADTTMEELN